MPLERIERPLTDAERATLQRRMTSLERAHSSQLIKAAGASAVLCALLCAATLAASDAPRVVIVLFWGAMTLGLTAWVGLSGRRDLHRQSTILRECLRHNRARVLRVRAARVVEFEEIEDEGACYAFQVSDDEMLFIQGQEFYADETFPNSDFSLIEVLTSGGTTGDVIISKTGDRLQPERRIDGTVKDVLPMPDDLEVVRGDLDRIEQVLRAGAAGR